MADAEKPPVQFWTPDMPVCMKCVSSLGREDTCPECGGDGFIFEDGREDGVNDWGDEYRKCPECYGEPAGWYCPTCKAFWHYAELDYPEETDND